MSVLNRIESLLELSQNASIVLQQKAATVKDSQQLGIILMAGRDLRAGIKDLVRIQDLYDESAGRPGHEYEASAEDTMERTRKFLHHAMKVSADDYIPSPPLSLSSLAAKSHPLDIHSSDPTDAVEDVKSEEDVEEFVDAVEDMPTPMSPPAQTTQLEDSLQDLSIEEPVPLKRSNSNFSLFSLPPNATWDPSSEETANTDPLAKSLTIEDYFPVPTRTLSTSPKLIASSASTPLPLYNSISFFNDDNETNARRSDVFASDVVVSHPLRIGVGYGSYVCYSCTVYSTKGASITARKRYSDFVQLRESLVLHYPRLKNNLPKLPPKKVVGKFTPAFIEKRRRELEYFLKYVSLHPALGSSMEVKRWLTQ
ncbi:hypothetical protein INT44_007183 [Umbelopsis vinacea]|uniref:Endosomal/vacuolar adapter protein YPT35 n=1 Tax=Umbelopsis vinacea TaxID=44442 RepID=A0A8H7PMQ6_9FUNG|nr:hypothetical protein INT44_007183 [Umbelopsis vinacea]